jgi:processive 1,2-diacylglycerol beta-glucosyltransferase
MTTMTPLTDESPTPAPTTPRGEARILILHASVGLGHRRAAEALASAFHQRGVAHVRVADTLDYARPLFRRLYAGSYRELSERAPALWAAFYERADQTETRLTRELRTLTDRLGVTRLMALVERERPDALICTHFLPLDLLDRQRRLGHALPPMYCVVTDYTGHAFWVYPGADGYFVASPRAATMLAERGVPPRRLAVTGIPVDPAIARPKDRPQTRRALGLERGPVITLIGSGLLVERVRQIVDGLLASDLAGTLVVAAGRNAALAEALAGRRAEGRLELRLLGFVDYMDDLLTASDLVVTKAGGLIVSEALARGRPLVLIDPIPGQEEWNADHVVSAGAGIQLRRGEMAPAAVARLLAHPDERRALEAAAARAGRPRAALTIADAVLGRVAPRHARLTA